MFTQRTVYSDADKRKHQSSASLAFVWENSPGTGEFPAWMASKKSKSKSKKILFIVGTL